MAEASNNKIGKNPIVHVINTNGMGRPTEHNRRDTCSMDKENSIYSFIIVIQCSYIKQKRQYP